MALLTISLASADYTLRYGVSPDYDTVTAFTPQETSVELADEDEDTYIRCASPLCFIDFDDGGDDFSTAENVTVRLLYSATIPSYNIYESAGSLRIGCGDSTEAVIVSTTVLDDSAISKGWIEADITSCLVNYTDVYLAHFSAEFNFEGVPRYTRGDFFELEVVVTEAVTTTPPTILTQNPNTTINVSAGTNQEFSITYSEADNDTVSFQWLVNNTDQLNNASTLNLDTTGFGEATHTVDVYVIDQDGNDTTSFSLQTYNEPEEVVVSGYEATYEAEDVDEIVVDGLSTALIVGVSFASLIALTILGLAIRRSFKGEKL